MLRFDPALIMMFWDAVAAVSLFAPKPLEEGRPFSFFPKKPPVEGEDRPPDEEGDDERWR